MVDCKECINKGQTNGLSQESFCSSCIQLYKMDERLLQ